MSEHTETLTAFRALGSKEKDELLHQSAAAAVQRVSKSDKDVVYGLAETLETYFGMSPKNALEVVAAVAIKVATGGRE